LAAIGQDFWARFLLPPTGGIPAMEDSIVFITLRITTGEPCRGFFRPGLVLFFDFIVNLFADVSASARSLPEVHQHFG
jgi:hypothetical protein